MRSSSPVHIFGPSSSSSLATQIIAPGIQPVLAARGAWGGIFRVDLDASRENGNISLVVLGDADHAAFDNITFVDDRDTILVTEDRGDTLHDQLNKLDSIWAYKLNQQHPERSIAARFVALGEDRMAPIATEEDNEPTGLHMSEGDSTIQRINRDERIQERPGDAFLHPAARRKQLVRSASPRLSRTDRPRQAGSAPDGKPSGAFFCAQRTVDPIERQLCGLSGQRCTATFEFVLAMGW